MSEEELAPYEAPFPSEEYKSATRVLPQLVPQFDEHASVEENKGAWKRVFNKWDKPFLTLFTDKDAVTRGG
jgi:haloalkane dehalogenase